MTTTQMKTTRRRRMADEQEEGVISMASGVLLAPMAF